ncbi:B-cell receptor CD22 [Arapaima gigas]
MKHGLDGLPYFYLLFLLHPGILQGLDSMNSGEVVYIQVQAKGVVGGSVKLECGLTLPDFYIWGYTAPGTENMHAVAYSFLQGTKLQALTKTLGNLSITTDTASLWIDQLPLVAQGLYTYQAFYKNTFQGDTFIYCYVQLFVLVPVSKPYILVSNTSLVEGTPMWMRCVLENGTEPVNYTWEQEDRDGFITKVAESNINQVNITFVNRNHTGRYRCQATNEVNRQYSDHIWLEVLFGPDVPLIDVTPHSVTEQGYSVFEKTTVSLTCQASSNPPSQYTWFYSNSQVHTGQQYNITSILRVNSGLYSCLAQNFILKTYLNSTVTIFVYYLPDGSPTCNIFPINNYTDLALWCLWEGGYPPASLHWSSHLLNPNVKASSPTNITVIQPGARTPHNSTFTCHGSHVVSPTSYICSTTACT